ncbi:MAG: TniQ family protein [Rhodococcus sp.]|nr:TniQ family protein [Rhodococcus sp. (in: high G+C Gram-positive bacteria)]
MTDALPPVHPSAYRLTQPDRRGILMRPLAFRPDPPPIAGESLLGLLARATHRNGFTGLMKVLSLADIAARSALVLPYIDPAEAERVAFVLKVPVGEILSRCHASASGESVDANRIDFFGIPLRARYRESTLRRVSPRALAISPHHRALHDLRPFSFCSETLEELLDACPVCHKPLGWFTTAGVAFCEHCIDGEGAPRVDLRDFPQPIVHINDEAALRFLTDLVNPVPSVREKALENVDRNLSGYGPGELFEFVILMARAVATPPSVDTLKLRNLRAREDFEFLTPDLLAQVGRALMDWRSGFQTIADSMRALAPERPGHFGVAKELGALRLLARHQSVPQGIRNLLKQTITEDMERTADEPAAPRRRALRHRDDLIDTQEAAARLGIKGGLVGKLARCGEIDVIRTEGRRSLMLFKASQIEEIRTVRRDMIDGLKAARQIALPLGALEALAEAGLIRRADGPALAIVAGKHQYRLSSLQELMTAIEHARQAGTGTEACRRFNAALRRLPAGEKPWVAIVRAVLTRELPVFGTDGSGGLFSRLLVEEARLRVLTEAAGVGVGIDVSDEPLAYREAAVYIGMSEPNVSWLVAAGLIDTTGSHDRRITRDALARFNDEFLHTAEIARRLAIQPSQVKRTLAQRGIEPVCALRAGMRLIWRRADVFGTETKPKT